MSLIGGLITLAYAIYRRDPVFAGQASDRSSCSPASVLTARGQEPAGQAFS
jgi:hypothetical protein